MGAAQQQQASAQTYIRESTGSTAADELAQLADLEQSGVITDDEFRQMKAKIVNS